MKQLYILLLIAIATPLASIAQKPTAYYTFINGQATDHVAGNDGTLLGGTSDTTDYWGGENHALHLEGVDGYVSIPDNQTTQPEFPFSVSFWVNLSDSSANNSIIKSELTGQSAYTGYWINTLASDPGKLNVHYGANTGNSINDRRSFTSTTVLNSNEWYHVCAVFLSHTTVGIYINGDLESATETGLGAEMAYDPGSYPTVFGKIGSNYLNGMIDNVSYYDYVLSSDDVFRIYHNVASYNFDNQSAEDLISSNHGTVNGAAYDFDIEGDANEAISFDGVDDLITVPETPTIQPDIPLSVSLWVKLDDASAPNRIFTNEDAQNFYSGIWINTTTANPGRITLNYGDATGVGIGNRQSFIGSTTLQNGEWYHIVAIVNSHQNATIYVNGVPETLTPEGNGGTMAYNASPWFMSFGGFNGNYFAGALDEINLYDFGLSLEDVTSLYGELDTSVGIDEVQENTIKIYPNPVSSMLNIELEENATIEIVDSKGSILAVEENESSIDCSQLNAGWYICRVHLSNGSIVTQKFVKR